MSFFSSLFFSSVRVCLLVWSVCLFLLSLCSPERRFKSISPCRRLFEDVSTNSNSNHIRASPSPFVVSNTTSSPSMTTTNFAPFFSNNNNHSKDNVTKDDNNEFNYYFDGIETNSKEPL